MARLTQAAKVGLFFLATGGAGYGVYRGLGGDARSSNGYVVHAHIKDATGLANHSRVTVAGIPVGSIEAIKLEGGMARIEVRMKPDVALFKNATIGKKSASLLGESMIVLTPGTEDQTRLKGGDEIFGVVEAPTTDQIMTDVARIADRVKLVSEQLAASLGTEQGGANMKRILENVAEATEALNLTIRENRKALKETLDNVDRITGAGAPQIAKILDNVRVITEEVKQLLAATGAGKDGKDGKDGKPGELRSTMERVNRASASLESALGHIDVVAARVDRGEGTLGRLSKDDALVNEIQGVAEGVGDYVDNIRRLQTVVGLRSDYNFLSNSIKSYVELRLQPREDKYYLIELINDPRGKTSFSQTDVATTNPNEPSNYRTTTTTTTDAFRFSIQFARRLGPFTGRFGIKESTGGLGLDIHLLKNRFEIVNDLFGFGESIRPRLRIYAGYEFLHRLWLLGGVDHIFLADRRDYFLGLSLRFTDDDLKTILPFAGGLFSGGR